MADFPLEHYEFGLLCLVEVSFTASLLHDVEFCWSYADFIILGWLELVHHYYGLPLVCVVALELFEEVCFWQNQSEHLAGHLAEHLRHPLGSLSAGWTHVNLENPWVGIMVEQYIEANELECAIDVLHALTACFYCFNYNVFNVFLKLSKILSENSENFLKFLLTHDAVAWIFETVFIQSIIAQMSRQPRQVMTHVVLWTYLDVKLWKHVHFEWVHTTYQHPLPQVKFTIV